MLSPSDKISILVADDDRTIVETLTSALERLDFKTTPAYDGQEALSLYEMEAFDIVITDLQMPKLDGMDLLKAIKHKNEEAIVLVITGYGTIRSAVEAVKAGAFDFIPKPFQVDELEIILNKALKAKELFQKLNQYRSELHYFKGRERYIYNLEGIVGRSKEIKQVLELVRKIAPTDATVLIQGETGTGKELIAAAIHYNSPRKNENFVVVNCAALPENLLESELFGHEKGAFTGADRLRIGRFELAKNGTLFLDEIGDMSLPTQAKVLRAIEEKEINRIGGAKSIRLNIRILAATNKDIKAEVEKENFRRDLYYRLSVAPVYLPLLRERKEDIPLLAEFFLKKYIGQMGRKIIMDPRCNDVLKSYSWPGNVRELENVIERSVLLMDGTTMKPEDIMVEPIVSSSEDRETSLTADEFQIHLPQDGLGLEEAERQLVIQALMRTGWIQKDAADLLKINKRMMHYKVRKYGIDIPKMKGASLG
jgi:DNA-binding NtrC family response regulator